MRINAVALLMFFTIIPVFSASKSNPETSEKLLASIYDSSPVMLSEFPAGTVICPEEMPHRLNVSPHNPWYYVDSSISRQEIDSPQIKNVIELYASIDINRFYTDVCALSFSLHPRIDTLFGKLVSYYQINSYVGNRSEGPYVSPGWFGGISMSTLLMLHHLAEIQENLPHESKLKALGIGVGGAFFESLLDAVGIKIMSMDVQDHRVHGDFMHTILSMRMKKDPALDQEKTIKVRDYSDVERRKIENTFFMPVKIYQQKTQANYSAIVDDVFYGADWVNTVLVFSWPRKFANDYIRHFIKGGGNALLFVRNQAVDSIFDDVYLGNSPLSKILSNFFRKTSLELNTATHSVVEVYCRGGAHPIEDALQRAGGYSSSTESLASTIQSTPK
ncbi:MAG: hypothetical protein NWS47_01555 [Alphaproteobacteria bacterium]|nr:hypothetical protein [Alphaproteobacteria bacterium]